MVGSGPARALSYEPTYPVSAFEIEYALDHPRHIPPEDLLDLEVGLRAREESYTAPRPVDRTVRMRLSSLPRGASFGASALLHVNQYIVSTFNRRGYYGVIVTVPDIEEGTGRDLRTPGDTVLRLRIWTGRVDRVTTFADGERFGGLSASERTNHAAHAWIRQRSPVRPGGPRGLLAIRALEDYVAELSRHPGRNATVEIEPGARTGTSAVNLRIAESKPWYVYAQYTNTGTSTTTVNRERFGFVHNQLLGRDDILQVDYTTGDFQYVESVVASYVAPFTLDAPEWRWALSGWWSRFDAEETGFVSTEVEGMEASAGGEISRQVFQHRELFIDAAAGARWQAMEVENQDFTSLVRDSHVDYVVPHADLRFARDTPTSSFRGRMGIEGGWTPTRDADTTGDPFVGGEARELDLLGTIDADDDFVLASFDASFSFYLEPLIDRQAWEDPETPRSSTLAHEIALLTQGQWAMGYRLVPQFRQVVGGFTTVRGYKQSVAVGDNLLLGSVEYRFHLPRLFSPDATPPELPGMGAFRVRPTHVWAAPDWDLIFRVFGDAARVSPSHALPTERSETLVSVGGGVELQVLRNLTLRADVGHTLSDLDETPDDDEAGETRGHVAATLLY